MYLTRDELIEFSKRVHDKMLVTLAAKNADYAGVNKDPFFNFTRVEAMEVCSTEVGFMTRMMDKVSRICTFIKKGVLTVSDETVEDTLIDLANYCILFAAYLYGKRRHIQQKRIRK